jgi:hypothetical protein
MRRQPPLDDDEKARRILVALDKLEKRRRVTGGINFLITTGLLLAIVVFIILNLPRLTLAWRHLMNPSASVPDQPDYTPVQVQDTVTR